MLKAKRKHKMELGGLKKASKQINLSADNIIDIGFLITHVSTELYFQRSPVPPVDLWPSVLHS